jgi:predicted kinase
MKLLIIVRGVPGAGKSTLIKSLNVQFAVSADDFHTDGHGNYNWTPENSKPGHKWCQDKVNDMMQSGYVDTIAVHNTFTQEWEMKPYFDMAKKHGYEVTTLIVENRHGNKNIHGVSNQAVQNMADRFEIKLI